MLITRKLTLGVEVLFKYIESEKENWKKYIEKIDDSEETTLIKKNTLTGLPAGVPEFIENLEKKFGRVLKAAPRGRPKKNKNVNK